MFEIRDPIHRTITFSEREKRLIDHPYVQRLRYVRQLGLSYLVYPGSTHDRFSHALGAMHVAGRVFSRICETSSDVLARYANAQDLEYCRETLRLAGLMHDLGHPPFSHVSEKFMPKFAALDMPRTWLAVPAQDRQAKHEDYSIVLIAAIAAESDSPLTLEQAQDIASLIHHGIEPSLGWHRRFGAGGGGMHRLLRTLISGELDCDRMDYLLRDAYFSGVAYGTHDLEHLVTNLGVTEQGQDGLTLTIDSTALRAFEDFLLSRYHMFLQVYMHKTTLGFDHFLDLAIRSGEFSLELPGDAKGYAALRDSTLIERLFAAAEQPQNIWSRRLANRVPAKMVFAATNAKAADRALLAAVKTVIAERRVPSFEVHTRQYLSRLMPSGASGSTLLVRKKMLGKFVFEPIETSSALLTKYNEVIDQTHLYVLPEDFAKIADAIAKL